MVLRRRSADAEVLGHAMQRCFLRAGAQAASCGPNECEFFYCYRCGQGFFYKKKKKKKKKKKNNAF
eukprot:NODE_25539_length_583_cov_5.072368.p2 GENE.NODE_25539_length_583_cov_5.072368~~NODE_25539_length_583_cov_5.072368.p2  ORF type:complete len:66 (+),score=30.83 NODE_25539_length_583_cov_5.072368:265-462(+)